MNFDPGKLSNGLTNGDVEYLARLLTRDFGRSKELFNILFNSPRLQRQGFYIDSQLSFKQFVSNNSIPEIIRTLQGTISNEDLFLAWQQGIIETKAYKILNSSYQRSKINSEMIFLLKMIKTIKYPMIASLVALPFFLIIDGWELTRISGIIGMSLIGLKYYILHMMKGKAKKYDELLDIDGIE